MSRDYHNHSLKPFIPPHYSTQNQDMRHGTIGSGKSENESQHDWNYSTL